MSCANIPQITCFHYNICVHMEFSLNKTITYNFLSTALENMKFGTRRMILFIKIDTCKMKKLTKCSP